MNSTLSPAVCQARKLSDEKRITHAHGLSTAHISPQLVIKPPDNSKIQPRFVCNHCRKGFVIWSGQCPSCREFDTLTSTIEHQPPEPTRGVYRIAEDLIKPPRLDVWIQGALVKVQKLDLKQMQRGGGRRDEVGPFNRSQRLRALRTLAKTEQEADSNFYTLTYSDAYAKAVCVDLVGPSDAGRKVKRDLDTLSKRLRRQHSNIGAFWRVETMDRKSGKHKGLIFPHVHGFFWGINDLAEFRRWLSSGWAETVAAGGPVDVDHVKAGIQVQEAKDWRAVMAYASKMVYATKPGDSQLEGLGRWWGAFNREAIPWSLLESAAAGSRSATMLYRTMRKYMQRVTKRRLNHWQKKGNSLTLFTDNPTDWQRLLEYYNRLYQDETNPGAERPAGGSPGGSGHNTGQR